MRREGRPHGMVRTYHVLPAPLNPRPPSRILNKLESPPTAGLFTRISQKPTNHSKFTGKCEKVRCSGCHLHPAWKSKDKSKGTQKLKTSDASVDYKQITWRVVGLNKMRNFGYSASGILDQLSDSHHYDDHYDDDDVDDRDDGDEYGHGYVEQGKREIVVETSHDDYGRSDDNVGDDVGDDGDDDDGNDDDNDDNEIVIHVGVTDDGDDGYKAFYDVAYVLNPVDVDEEGWSFVG